MTLLTSEQYKQDLLAQLKMAKHRIAIASMVLYYEDGMTEIFTALKNALDRGVIVAIVVDSYNNFLFTEGSNLFKLVSYRHRIRATRQAFAELREHGATITEVGSVGPNPYKRRFHYKCVVVDDVVYFAGGVNMTRLSFEQTDYMLRTQNTQFADDLVRHLSDIATNGKQSDTTLYIDQNNTLFIDSGAPDKSIIYDRAVALSKQAESIVYVSQLAPSGPLASLLRQKNAVLYFNRPAQLSFPASLDQYLSAWQYRQPNSYQGEDFIHAKYMLFTLPGDKKIALSGSHNFSYRGVQYGTKELALEATSPAVWNELQQFTNRRIATRSSYDQKI
ncbi:MAG TPA: phospholipase D-like domain-containing protein [Candidatus Saccharimonadales bacterium]